MIDVICKNTKKYDFGTWYDMYNDELREIYSIEGADLEGQDFEKWVEDFYDAEGTVP
jgi:hypothetical protein